jgi:hypothetical protein
MNKLFPIRNRKTFVIRMKDGDLYKYDDGKIVMGTRSYLKLLMDNVLRDFSEATIVEATPAITRVKNKT